MKLSFKRITTTGNFIPEIDGLRFIAITSVVCFHLSGYLQQRDPSEYIDSTDYSLLTKLFSHGFLGVPLFFVISGFILGMPFAKWHILKEKPVSLKKYFIRRLTRLEPPYILVMTLMLFGIIFVAKIYPQPEGIQSYLASIFYVHNFIYLRETLPLLNSSAWSLEIEIQFYILAPLMATMFLVKSPGIRRRLLLTMVIVSLILSNMFKLPFMSLFDYFHYFFIGFLMADLYISDVRLFPKTRFDQLIGLTFFIIIWLFIRKDFDDRFYKFIWESIQLTSIFFFYYYVLFHKTFNFLSKPWVTAIGGMCYSIYLLHLPVITVCGKILLPHAFSDYSYVNGFMYLLILSIATLIFSSIFFLLVERPCMDKDWYKKIFRKRSPVVS